MKHIWKSPFFYIPWIIICSLITMSLAKHLLDITRAQQLIKDTEQRVTLLEKENQEKRKRIEEATSPFTREEMIRNQLGMQKPGEIVVQVEQAPSQASQTSVPEKTRDAESGFGEKFLEFFARIWGSFFK